MSKRQVNKHHTSHRTHCLGFISYTHHNDDRTVRRSETPRSTSPSLSSSPPIPLLTASKTPQRLKSALWFSIGKIVDEETINLGANASPHFIGSLTELVWAQIESTAQDLQAFANHAGRNTVGVEDVMMLARRSEDLGRVLRSFAEKLEGGKKKRQKRK